MVPRQFFGLLATPLSELIRLKLKKLSVISPLECLGGIATLKTENNGPSPRVEL
jgi:hypothetical protein